MKKKLVVIIGPTAAKKTTIAHCIALQLNGAIINGDAFQIYSELNVGVNKPSLFQRKEVDYYLLDFLKLNQNYSIKQFQNDFSLAYESILSSGKIPILCGGSHLYVDAVLRGYDLSVNLQNELEEVKKWTLDKLNDYVFKYDKISYLKNINNIYRLQRCAAYLLAHENKPKSSNELILNNSEYDPLIIMINVPREILYQKINQRFDSFYANNKWIDEVKKIIDKYGNDLSNYQSMKAIGYTDIYHSIVNGTNLDIEKIKQKTRRLAKHQLTWCNNKFEKKIIFNPLTDSLDDLIAKISKYYGIG